MEKRSDNRIELDAIANRRLQGEKIVFTNGCFDLLHVGHTRYLTQARLLGDLLVIGLNSDSSVKRLKGPTRPLIDEQERKELLLALRSVDYVCIFEEDDPLELIKQVRPHVLVKGGDWPVEKIVGANFVASTGGLALSLPFVDGRSTTSIINKILSGGSSL